MLDKLKLFPIMLCMMTLLIFTLQTQKAEADSQVSYTITDFQLSEGGFGFIDGYFYNNKDTGVTIKTIKFTGEARTSEKAEVLYHINENFSKVELYLAPKERRHWEFHWHNDKIFYYSRPYWNINYNLTYQS